MAFKSSEFTGRPPVVSVPNSFFLLPTYENCAESEKKTQNRLSRKLYFTMQRTLSVSKKALNPNFDYTCM